MKIVKTTAAAVIAGLLIGGVCVQTASAASAGEALTTPPAASAKVTARSAATFLGLLEFPRIDVWQKSIGNCKPGQLYSAHDIVGDSEACIKGSSSSIENRGTIATMPAPAL